MYACICVLCLYSSACVHVGLGVSCVPGTVYVIAHMQANLCMCVSVGVCAYVCVHVYVCVCMRMYVHAHRYACDGVCLPDWYTAGVHDLK